MLRNFNSSILFLFATSILSACSHSPYGRDQLIIVSEHRVNEAGTKTFQRIKDREMIDTDVEDNKLVQCVVQALARQTPERSWEAVIFKNDEANAFALPGDKIGVNSGLLRVTVNQDQLAAVLGHEMGHVIAQHGRERMSQQVSLDSVELVSKILSRGTGLAANLTSSLGTVVQLGILYPFTQTQENEADLIGLDLAAHAGFHPQEAIQFWKNMDVYSPPSQDPMLSGHPTNHLRIENLSQHLGRAEMLATTSPSRPSCDQ